jgi:CRISPR-associated protein Csd2
MNMLQHKIDFAVILCVDHANPNGDPLNGNRPRTDYGGLGEISDVCLKRKLRDRLQDKGEGIFVQSDDRKIDGMRSLRERAESDIHGLGKNAFIFKKPKKNKKDDVEDENDLQLLQKEETARAACAKWFDVRAFGQLFAFKGSGAGNKKNDVDGDTDAKKNSDADGVSIPIRGPVTLRSAFSVEPVSVTSIQITKSVSSEGDGSKKSSDTMGMKHRVDKGIYVFYGSMNPQLAERTGFSDQDAETIKDILPKLFENDASSARPEGSMTILHVFWWKHNCKSGQYSSAKVHNSLRVNADGSYTIDADAVPGLKPEIIPGF